MAQTKSKNNIITDIEQTNELISEKSSVDLDYVLVAIGQFGKFQWRTILLTTIVCVFSGFQSDFVFTAARIKTRCYIPECDFDTPEFSPTWLSNAIPYDDNCHHFSGLNPGQLNVTCPGSIFNQSNLVACEKFVYENQQSVVYDFGLGCDEWRRALIGTMRTLGTLVALPITGFISDRWGRRVALTLNAVNTCWLGLARYWANNYTAYIISQFVEAALGSGFFSCIHISVLELVGPEFRVIASGILVSCAASGQALLGFIAWNVPSWRSLTLALYLPQLLSITYFWIFPESIRWYMSKGFYEKSETLLKKVAYTNKKFLPEKILEKLRENSIAEKRRNLLKRKCNSGLIARVFQNKQVLLRCLVTPLWWATMTLMYYGLSINAVDFMPGNGYFNYMLVSAVNVPGFWISVILLPRIGRRLTLIAAFWIGAVCQLSYIFVSSDMLELSLVLYLMSNCSIAVVASALYVYTTEIYPTECRHSLFAYSSMIGRFGSITATLIPAVSAVTFEKLPFVVFSTMAFLSGLTVLLTPETLNIKLPDTMEQANELGNKESNNG